MNVKAPSAPPSLPAVDDIATSPSSRGDRLTSTAEPMWTVALRKLAVLGCSAWFAYSSIVALQLSVMWGDWLYRDMPFGDTSFYFPSAYGWFARGVVNPLWSPLYTMFWGTFFHFFPDADLVTYSHRFVIIMVTGVLVLAVARRLLPAPIAWLLAAWWCLLHINYAILYEVHLFAFIPLLLSLLAALWIRGRWGRGIALGILIASAILVRNEHGFGAAILAVACLWYERSRFRAAGPTRAIALRRSALAYGIPILVAISTLPFILSRSSLPEGYFPVAAEAKTTLLMCMSYANVYQERYPGVWTKSPWIDCGELMELRFGRPVVSYGEAFRQDPRDMIGHVLWNFGLLSSGVEYALFNGVAGSSNPDFVPVPLNQTVPRILGPILILLLVVGGALLRRRWTYWWTTWILPRVWAWVILLSMTAIAVIVTAAVKPRPEYLHGFWFLIMALAAVAAAAVVERWIGMTRLAAAIPLIALVGILFVPRYYDDPAHVKPRVILDEYQKLSRFADAINRPDTVLLHNGWVGELRRYLAGRPGGANSAAGLHFAQLTGRRPGVPIEDVFEQNRVTVAHLDADVLKALEGDPDARTFLASPEAVGWKLIGAQEGGGPRWRLYQRVPISAR
jgi:hypothetical protein